MLTVASLLAAMTIAGAFWVGVLAARRLRDWGDGRRMIEEAEAPLALAAAPSGAVDDPASRRVRALVAERLQTRLARGSSVHAAARPPEDLTVQMIRIGDVAVVETAEMGPAGGVGGWDGDYMVEGIVLLNEGDVRTTVLVVNDAGRRRWLVGRDEDSPWFILDPVAGHGLAGEPPRHVQRGALDYGLERRGQGSAAVVGQHGRPDGSRVSKYIYRATAREVLWVERWGREILMGEGREIPAHAVSFLPGS